MWSKWNVIVAGETWLSEEKRKEERQQQEVSYYLVYIVLSTHIVYREKYLSLCGEALELAKSMLSHSPSLQDFAQFQHMSRHGSVMSIPMASGAKVSSADKSSPKTRSRANTLVSAKPILTTDDIKSTKHRGVKSKGTKVERSQTFLGKDEKKDRPHISYVPTQNLHHRSNSSASGGTGLDDTPDGCKGHSNNSYHI